MDIYNDLKFYGIDSKTGFRVALAGMKTDMPDNLKAYPKRTIGVAYKEINSILDELLQSLYGLDIATRRTYNRGGSDHVGDSDILFSEIEKYIPNNIYIRFKPLMDNITNFNGVPSTFSEYGIFYYEIERCVTDDMLFAIYELFYDQFLVDTYAVYSEFLYNLENLLSFSNSLFDNHIDRVLNSDSANSIEVSAILMYAKSFFGKKFNAIEAPASYSSIYNMYLNHKKRYEMLHCPR